MQLQGGIAAGMMQHGFGPQEKFPRPKRTKPDGNQEFKQCFLRMRNTIGSLEHLNAVRFILKQEGHIELYFLISSNSFKAQSILFQH